MLVECVGAVSTGLFESVSSMDGGVQMPSDGVGGETGEDGVCGAQGRSVFVGGVWSRAEGVCGEASGAAMFWGGSSMSDSTGSASGCWTQGVFQDIWRTIHWRCVVSRFQNIGVVGMSAPKEAILWTRSLWVDSMFLSSCLVRANLSLAL